METVERCSLLNDYPICAERSCDHRRCGKLDALGRGHRSIDDAVDDNAGRSDIALDTRQFADGQRTAANRDRPFNPPVDGQVLLAREFSGDDERGADDGHA